MDVIGNENVLNLELPGTKGREEDMVEWVEEVRGSEERSDELTAQFMIVLIWYFRT